MKTRNIQVFSYYGTDVRFKKVNGITFISATDLSRAHNKQASDFFKRQATCEFINLLHHKLLKINLTEIPLFAKLRSPTSVQLARIYPNIIKAVKGGDPQNMGIWIHEKLARRYAIWVDQEFALWVDDQVEKFQKGEVITFEEAKALTDLIHNCLRFVSTQKKLESNHFKVWLDEGQHKSNWHPHRDHLFGIDKKAIISELATLGKKYQNKRAGWFILDPVQAMKVVVIDLYRALGRDLEYATNVAQWVELVYRPELHPVYNDEKASIPAC